MTEEQIALAKRAAACPKWWWVPGMRVLGGDRITERTLAIDPGALPDLTDPATLGCLLALVREHHKEPRLAVVPTGKGWSVSRVWLRSPHDRVAGVHTLEAEAIVAALEAAP